MNFVQMLMRAPDKAPTAPKPKKKRATASHWPAVRAKTQGRYRLAMEGRQRVTSEIAASVGTSHVNTLKYLHQYEKQGLVKRAGLRPTLGNRPTIVWEWVNG